MSKVKVTVEFDVDVAQELAASTETTVSKIDWVLENRTVKNKEELDERAKKLTIAATAVKKALHARALANEEKVVKIK
jgi:hypothetical protein